MKPLDLRLKASARLEEAPYTFVRTRVMRTLLIPKGEYLKLLKMKIAEISNYLGESQYKQEINELGVRYSGIQLIERALNRNFLHSITKLRRISPESYTTVIDAYLIREDIYNLKTIIRGKKAGMSKEDIQALLLPVGMLRKEKLSSILDAPLSEIIKALPCKVKNENDLIDIETSLDRYYFNEIKKFCTQLPSQGKLFKDFLEEIVHTANVLTFLRLRKEKLQAKEIESHMIFTDDIRETHFIRKLLKTRTMEEIENIVEKSKYKKFIDVKEMKNTLIGVESMLQVYLLKKTIHFEHQNPLSIYSILSYLFAKKAEINNLKKIVKAKHLGIDMSVVEGQLVL